MRSDSVKTGHQAAPARSLMHALGLTNEEIRKPLIGIVSSYNEIVPGQETHHHRQTSTPLRLLSKANG